MSGHADLLLLFLFPPVRSELEAAGLRRLRVLWRFFMARITATAFRRAFGPEEIDAMATALDAAWNVLRLAGNEGAIADAAATRALLAKRIIRRAQKGENNYGRLLMVALDGLLPGELAKARKALSP
jgi:hypothetical protein